MLTLAMKVILGNTFNFPLSTLKAWWTCSHICGVEANLAVLDLQL